MKMLEYTCGFINLEEVNFMEIVVKRDSKDILSCWLEIPGRDIFLLSCETEEDARTFKEIFWEKLKSYVLEYKEDMIKLNDILHDVLGVFFIKEKI